jgi:hypothetical protein
MILDMESFRGLEKFLRIAAIASSLLLLEPRPEKEVLGQGHNLPSFTPIFVPTVGNKVGNGFLPKRKGASFLS